MSDILCGYQDREATLMAYVYDEIAPSDRDAFEAHLATCARCRVELNALGGVRAQLARWAPPDYRQSAIGRPLVSVAPKVIERPVVEDDVVNDVPAPARDIRWGWRDIPAWAQVAAAVLVLGVSAGMANLNIHYDPQNGLNIRTGWSQGPQGSQGSQGSLGSLGSDGSHGSQTAELNFASRAELTALEQQLRSEIQTATASVARAAAPAEGEVPRRVKVLLDESERRHERELALRIAEVIRDVNVQRQSDLRKIDQNIGEGRVEVLRNQKILYDYMQRVSRPQ